MLLLAFRSLPAQVLDQAGIYSSLNIESLARLCAKIHNGAKSSMFYPDMIVSQIIDGKIDITVLQISKQIIL